MHQHLAWTKCQFPVALMRSRETLHSGFDLHSLVNRSWFYKHQSVSLNPETCDTERVGTLRMFLPSKPIPAEWPIWQHWFYTGHINISERRITANDLDTRARDRSISAITGKYVIRNQYIYLCLFANTICLISLSSNPEIFWENLKLCFKKVFLFSLSKIS